MYTLGGPVGAVGCYNDLFGLPRDGGGAESERETNTDGEEPAGTPEAPDTDQDEGQHPPRQEIPGKVVILKKTTHEPHY